MLIGLIGNKRVGKDTIANILVNKYQFKKLAFADPIKEVINLLFDLDTSDNVDKEKVTDYGVSLRTLYQKFGTELMQEGIYKYFPEMEDKIPKKMFWVYKLFKHIENYKTQNINKFVISDVRFLHEANYVKEQGGILIKIHKETNLVDEHVSEKLISHIPNEIIDYEVYNNSTIKDLEYSIDLYINELFNNN